MFYDLVEIIARNEEIFTGIGLGKSIHSKCCKRNPELDVASCKLVPSKKESLPDLIYPSTISHPKWIFYVDHKDSHFIEFSNTKHKIQFEFNRHLILFHYFREFKMIVIFFL
jgi:hypothetical protein